MGRDFMSYARDNRNLGQLPKPDGYAHTEGDCGDSIEMFLSIKQERITAATFMPHGCLYTYVCASALTDMAQGISLEDALSLEAEDLEKTLGGLPPDHHHCAVLAISSLRDAVSDYFQNARASWKRLYAR